MDRYRGFQVKLLCGAGGAEITGTDAACALEPEVVAELRRALAEHCIIFLREQGLMPEQQKATGASWIG